MMMIDLVNVSSSRSILFCVLGFETEGPVNLFVFSVVCDGF
jgi:hypothetical protein